MVKKYNDLDGLCNKCNQMVFATLPHKCPECKNQETAFGHCAKCAKKKNQCAWCDAELWPRNSGAKMVPYLIVGTPYIPNRKLSNKARLVEHRKYYESLIEKIKKRFPKVEVVNNGSFFLLVKIPENKAEKLVAKMKSELHCSIARGDQKVYPCGPVVD